MPVTPTGLQPAQPPLTAGAESGPVSRRQSPPAAPPPLLPTVTHTHPPAQRLRRQLDPTSLSLTPRPNPHRAGGTDSASPPRDFVPWRFSDAGLPACGAARHCRRPKTCTTAAIRRLLERVSFTPASRPIRQLDRSSLLCQMLPFEGVVGGSSECMTNTGCRRQWRTAEKGGLLHRR